MGSCSDVLMLMVVATSFQEAWEDWQDAIRGDRAELPEYGSSLFGWLQVLQWHVQRSAIPVLLGLAVVVIMAKVALDWIRKARQAASGGPPDYGPDPF